MVTGCAALACACVLVAPLPWRLAVGRFAACDDAGGRGVVLGRAKRCINGSAPALLCREGLRSFLLVAFLVLPL